MMWKEAVVTRVDVLVGLGWRDWENGE